MLLTGRRRQALLMSGTLALAVFVTAGISGWVLAADPGAGVSEALRTGGVAGASVVALYALWLNDRRRRVEEDRQAVEEERLRAERGRTSHERFARAIEMLGNDADQVRVGAMHALVGLTRDTPSYAQTVIDVLCSYLRRPFFHHAYAREGHEPDRSDFADPLVSSCRRSRQPQTVNARCGSPRSACCPTCSRPPRRTGRATTWTSPGRRWSSLT